MTTGNFYFQDSLGNTSHVTDATGNLLESYTYSAFGTPTFYNASPDHTQSLYHIKHLFQGQLWTQETGLNDYRNRVEFPTMGVFLQPDPIGFKGDAANIYRFCGNDPVDRTDPLGLIDSNGGGSYSTLTSFGGGDWIKGSDGLSASDWNHKHDQAGMDGGAGQNGGASAGNDNGGVTMGWRSKEESSKPTEYKTALAAARSREKEVGADAKTSKDTEWISEVGQAKDQSGKLSEKYVAVNAHLGLGIKKDGNGHAQKSGADENNLPPGYRHIVGFVVGYNYYDTRFITRDINTAIGANYKVAIIIGEMRGAGNKVVVYEKRETTSNLLRSCSSFLPQYQLVRTSLARRALWPSYDLRSLTNTSECLWSEY